MKLYRLEHNFGRCLHLYEEKREYKFTNAKYHHFIQNIKNIESFSSLSKSSIWFDSKTLFIILLELLMEPHP